MQSAYGKMKAVPGPGRVLASGCALLLLLALTLPARLSAQQGVDEAKTTPQSPGLPTRSNVYYIHDPTAIQHYVINSERVHSMVERLLLAVTGKETVNAAWESLVSPKDVVGIKISTTGGASGATHRAVVTTLVEGLMAAGIPRSHILVWDREEDDLRAAGYLPPHGQPGADPFVCPVQAIEPRWGYDPKAIYTSAVLGKLIWGDLLFQGKRVPADEPLRPPPDAEKPTPSINPNVTASAMARGLLNPNMRLIPGTAQDNLSNASHYCTILSKKVTKVINVPVLSDNVFAGFGGALYNMTIPNIDNWRRLVGSPRYGATAIPEMFSDPAVGGKVVLNITDGLVAQLAGGPIFQPFYARHHATLYASKDAVAIDAVTLRYLELWRAQAQLPPIKDAAAHVRTAGDIGLGNFAPEKIDLHKL